MKNKISYSSAILKAFKYILKKEKNSFVIGQGLWSPWYVGETMKDLDKIFGKKRIIDSPVSENAVTGIALGSSLNNSKPICIHPRMDFMLLAVDQIVNQAAKWRSMLGGNSSSNLTIRSIINRGGEQGAQHSQSLHSWFAHIPGLVVVMPYSAVDAHDLLIASVESNNPVIYIDDRWLYDGLGEIKKYKKINILKQGPKILKKGKDLTVVGCGWGTKIGFELAGLLKENNNVDVELIDLRILNPLKIEKILRSVKKTRKLAVIDPAWKNCSISSEIISSVHEKSNFKFLSKRFNLMNYPAPTAKNLEKLYYPNSKKIFLNILKNFF